MATEQRQSLREKREAVVLEHVQAENRHDIAASVEVTQRFTRMLLQLFSSLAGLDYIGKKREAGIFVKEQLLVPDQEVVVRRRTSFLAD